MADEKTFTKEDVDKAVEAAVAKVQESIDKLEAKNEELVGDLRKARAEARKAKEIDPAEVERLEAQVEELTGKLTAAEKAAKDATTTAEKATKALEAESAFTQKLLIQDGLKSALIGAGVKDEDHLDVLSAKFAGGAKVVTEGDERKAMYGDKPLTDFIKEWAGTDSGKKYVAAPANSGGGAGGGKGGEGGPKTVTRAEFDAMSHTDRSKFSVDGGKVVDATA